MKDKKWKIPEQRQWNPGEPGYDPTKDPNSPEENLIDAWTDRAVRRIVLPKERKKCRAELVDHMIDRHIEGLNHGLSPQAAARKAVEVMGDPDETGALLRKIHQPWASWMLCLTRVLLVLVLGWALISGALFGGDSYGSATKETVLKRRTGSTGELGSFGCFDVSVVSAEQVLGRNDWYKDDTMQSTDSRELRITLRFSSAPWYRPDSGALARSIWIRDDQGRVFAEWTSAIPAQDMPEQWWYHRDLYVQCESSPNLFGQNDVTVTISNNSSTEWMELFYNWNGTERSIKIWFDPWEEGDVEALSEEEAAEAARALAEPERVYSDNGSAGSMEIVSARAVSVEGEPEDGRVCIPWARLFRCEDPADLQEENPEPCWYMQCVVAFRGMQAADSFSEEFRDGRMLKLNAVHKQGYAQGQTINWIQVREESSEDTIFYLVQWECTNEMSYYELSINGGKNIRITLTPGEEIAE
ncbi:MAG: hypothetical protein J5789_01025 [Oscillospiraceae bacterium]|nr:hypothetical protein [Oscillospiraceae bacterium]